MLKVKSAEGGNSDSFVWVDAVKADCSLLECKAAPLFESALVEKEINVLLVKFAYSFIV